MYSLRKLEPGSNTITESEKSLLNLVSIMLGSFVCETIGQFFVKISSPANTSFSGFKRLPTILNLSD